MTAEPYTRREWNDITAHSITYFDDPERLKATVEAAWAENESVRYGKGCKCDPPGSGEEWCVGTCVAKAEVKAYKALQRHQQAIIMGKDAADAARSVIAGHEEARREYARHWEKLDDELCPACAQANTILRLDAEIARLRGGIEQVLGALMNATISFPFAEAWAKGVLRAALARGDAAVEA